MISMNRIPTPPMSQFLYDEFMLPMNLDAQTVTLGANIPFEELQSILADDAEITPEISEKLGRFFGVSALLFYDIQQDICEREQQHCTKLVEYA